MKRSKKRDKVRAFFSIGKSLTTSVPTIRYHASDGELEELYPSSEDEKQPELSKFSPLKNFRSKSSNASQGSFSKERSSSMDGITSESTLSSSDTWSKLSQIKGKISKTIEDKITEIKKERKRRKLRYQETRDTFFTMRLSKSV